MSSTTQTIRQHGTIPWTSHTRIGAGYDPLTHEVLASPFFGLHSDDDSEGEDNEVAGKKSELAVTLALHDELFTDAVRLADYLQSWTSGPGPPLSGKQMKDMGDYVKQLCCGPQNGVHVLCGTVIEEGKHFHEELLLTPQAKALLTGDVDKFAASYGQYCVAGYVRQTSFVAISTSDADDESTTLRTTLSRATTGLSLRSGKSKGNGTATANGAKNTSSVESRKLFVSGLKTGNDLAITSDSDLTKVWEAFKETHELLPRVALLEHYSSLLPNEIARPARAATLGFDISSASWQCAVLQMLSRSLAADARTATERLEDIHGRLASLTGTCEPAEMREAEKLGDELQSISAALHDMARASKARKTIRSELEAVSVEQESLYPEGQWSHKPFNTSPETTWTLGLTPDTFASLNISPDIPVSHVKTCVLADSDRMTTQKPEPLRIEVPGCRIIGAVVKNRYADPRHGGKWARVGGWLGRDTFSVRFETQHFRGCDWELTVWSVSEEMFVREL